jgi:hypothetical protein
MSTPSPADNGLTQIPPPDAVLRRLGEVLREATILRKQLRLSKAAARELETRQGQERREVAHASR